MKMASGSKPNYNMRLQMGCLVIAGKKYPLYEGLNRIGRSKDATVVIKDENVSQQHAIITIVDDNQHFVSDLNSCNGTIVGNGSDQKLYPLVLFELVQDSVIKFANVISVYQKVPSNMQSVTDHSYNDGSIKKLSSTQSINESFYSAQTQILATEPVVKSSIDTPADLEMPFNYFEDEFSFADVHTLPLPHSNGLDKNEPMASTSKTDLSIHEAPTQIFCSDVANDNDSLTKSLAIHDLPTQIMCYEVPANVCVGGTQIINPDNCNLIGDAVAGRTEIIHNKEEMGINTPVTQSGTVYDKPTQSTVSKESRDHIDVKTNIKSNVGTESNMIHDLPTQISNEVDVNLAVTQRDIVKDKATQLTINSATDCLIDGNVNAKNGDVSNVIHDPLTQNNSEVDINSVVTQRDTIHYKPTQLTEIEDTLHDDDLYETSPKNHRKSLANLSVDVIDTSLLVSVSSRSIVTNDNERASTSKSFQEEKTLQDSDSQSQLCVNQLYRRTLKPITDDSQGDEPDASGSEVVKSHKVNRKPLLESSSSNSESEEVISKSKRISKSRIILDKSDSETDMDEDLQGVDETSSKGKSVGGTADNNELSGSDTEVEDLVEPKLVLNAEHKKASVAMSKIFTSTVIEELTEAQQIDEVNSDSDSNDFEFDLRKKDNERAEQLNDSDVILSTQPAKDGVTLAPHGDVTKLNLEETEDGTIKKSKELLKLTEWSEDSFCLGISEILAGSEEIVQKSKNCVISTTNQDEDEDKTPDISDVDEPEDAKLNQDVGDKKCAPNVSPNSTNSTLIVDLNDKSKEKNADDTQDIFEMATQKIPNESIQGKSDEMFLKPTFNKSLNSTKKKSFNKSVASQHDEDIFMQATQKIGNDYSLRASQPSSSIEDDDIFMQPTQKCTTDGQDGNEDIFMQPTQAIVLSAAGQDKIQTFENQDREDIFMQATQPITSLVRTIDDPVQNEPSLCLKHNLQEKQPESVESQLEVMFASQTLRMSSQSNSRPSNPLSNVLNKVEMDDEDSDGSVKSTASLKEYSTRPTLPIDELNDFQVGRCGSSFADMGGTGKLINCTAMASVGVVSTLRKRGRPLKMVANEVEPTSKKEMDDQESSNSGQSRNDNQKGLTKMQADGSILPHDKDDGQERTTPKQAKCIGLGGSLKSTRSSTRVSMELKENIQAVTSAQNSDEIVQTKKLLKNQTKRVPNATSTVTNSSRTINIIEEEIAKNSIIKHVNTGSKVEEMKKQMSEPSHSLNFISTRSSKRVKTIEEETGGSSKTENINTNSETEDKKKQTRKVSHTLNLKPARTRTRINIGNEIDSVNESTSNARSKATTLSRKSTEVDDSASSSNTDKTDTHLQTNQECDPPNAPLTRSGRRTFAADQGNVEKKEDAHAKAQVKTRKRKSDSNNEETIQKMKSTEDKDMAEENIPTKTSKLNKGKVVKPSATTRQTPSPGVLGTRSSRTKNANTESLALVITVASDSDDEASVAPAATPKSVKARSTKSRKGKTAKLEAVKEDSMTVIASTSPVLPLNRRGKRLLSCDSTTSKPQSSTTKKMKRSSEHDETKFDSDFGEKSFQSPNRNKSATSITTPDRNRRVTKPKVVFTMLDSPTLQSIIRRLGGSVVDSIDTATVLVTGSLKRSLKLLTAVGQGKPICSQQWIQECKKANKFLDPWDFLLKDDEAEKKWKFSLSESLNRSQNRKILEGFTVLVLVNNTLDVLKGAIESCGGKCVLKLPVKSINTNLVVVADHQNRSKYSKFLKHNPPVTVVAPEAIFDGVLRQELHWEDHRLS